MPRLTTARHACLTSRKSLLTTNPRFPGDSGWMSHAPDRVDGALDWHAMDAQAVADALGVTLEGLPSSEAASRLLGFGPNTFEVRRMTHPTRIPREPWV